MIRRLVSNMKRIVPLNTQNMEEVVGACGGVLRGGGVVATPTDTVYGIATLIPHVHRLYHIKGRDPSKPVAICLPHIPSISKWAEVSVPDNLLEDLLPGPVTLVFQRSPQLPEFVNKGHPLVGIRIPNAPFIRRLCETCDGPLALTSANPSGASSSLSIKEFSPLWEELDVIVDGGELGEGADGERSGSTVIDLSLPGYYKIIRRGSAFRSTTKILTSSKYNLTEFANEDTTKGENCAEAISTETTRKHVFSHSK